jgi:DUF1680 family protein
MLTAKRLHRLAMIFALTGALCLSAVAQKNTAVRQSNPSTRQALPFNAVQIQDSFWTPKQKICRDSTIPHSWQYVQGEIEDNEIAAGWRKETRSGGLLWTQANLHKVLETAAYALGQESNGELDKKVDSIIAIIAAAQRPDGYANAFIITRGQTPWANLGAQHDGYIAGHLIEAAVAHYETTGKRNFLDVACKLADHIHRYFILEKNEGYCGHAELELALVRLYRATGRKEYLQLAQEWIERRGKPWSGWGEASRRFYAMDQLPVRKMTEVTGHAVRAMFYATGIAEVANEAGDESLKGAARRLWRNTIERKMYVVGAVGSQEEDEAFGPDYHLPNKAYAESCANCGLLYLAQAMFLLDGESGSIDVLERALYNAVLHGISLDGTTTYYRNPLTDALNPRNNIWICCPPCLSRTLLRVQEYIYARDANSLYVNLYVGSTARFTLPALNDNEIELQQQTNYPWDGGVKITINPAQPATFALRLRLPSWCRAATLRVNGKTIERPTVEKGYAVLTRRWSRGDTVELDLPMPVERIEANPLIKGNNGLVALQRGPLVYGFEGLDNGGGVDFQLAADTQFVASHRDDWLGGVTKITTATSTGQSYVGLPFYVLANRAPSQQRVWIPQNTNTPTTTSSLWRNELYRQLAAQ